MSARATAAAAAARQAGPSSRLLEVAGLPHEDLIPAIDAFLAARRLTWHELERGDLWAGRLPFASLDELQWYLICADPVLWAETQLVEKPEDGGGPWRLFDYQKPAARWQGSLVLKCAAETGKSRHLILRHLYLWDSAVAIGSQLCCASQDGHLDLLYNDLLYYIEANPRLAAQIDPDKTRVKPYKRLVNRSGGVLHFRPAGSDGEAIRGVHVSLRASFDEAAKAHNERIFIEFFRSTKPSLAEGRARAREAPTDIVSVPDGRTDTDFYRLAQQAHYVEWRPDRPADTDAQLAALDSATATVRLAWRKSYMPPPFWTSERKQHYLEVYGGIDSNGYRQNVEGEDGDPANSILPWPVFIRLLKPLPDYVSLQLVWDADAATVHLDASRPDPSYTPSGGRDRDPEAVAALRPMLPIVQDEPLPVEEILGDGLDLLFARYLPELHGPMVAGADLGATDDPTEVLLWGIHGDRLRLVLRVTLRRWPYPHQRRAFTALHRRYEPSYGWGLDATGVGTAVFHEILADDYELGQALTGFVWNASLPERSPATGEETLDPETQLPRRVSYKEQATQLLEHGAQHAALEVPWDPDILRQWPGHTATISSTGRRSFARTDDHTIDAARAGLLRRFLLEHGALAPVSVTFASLGRRRDLDHDAAPSRRLGRRGAGHPLDDLVGGDAGRPFAAGGESAATALRDW